MKSYYQRPVRVSECPRDDGDKWFPDRPKKSRLGVEGQPVSNDDIKAILGESKRTMAFTGTRRGMTTWQMNVVKAVLSEYTSELVHGECEGSDYEADLIARQSRVLRTAHPCGGKHWKRTTAETRLPHTPPLDRGRKIVNRG